MNTIQQQFADEWKKVSAVVESETRRQLLTFGHLDYYMLNAVLRDERETWFKSLSARHQWLEGLTESEEIDKVQVTTKLRQTHLQDVYHVGNKRLNMARLKVLYLTLSFFVGFMVWFGTDLYFTPNTQEYLSSPLKWIAFPLLAIVLTYTLCLPRIAQAKKEKMQKLVQAVTEEMRQKGQEILQATLKKSHQIVEES